MNLGVGGIDRDQDVITDIVEDIVRSGIIEEEIVPKGFIYYVQVSSSERRELEQALEDAEDDGLILTFAWHVHDYKYDRF